MFIYKITNKLNNKIYIGKTVRNFNQLLKRYKDDVKRLTQTRPIVSSIRKNGFDNYNFEIIVCVLKKEYLDDLEKYFIKLYNCMDRNIGYNCTPGGDGLTNPSLETRIKMGRGIREYCKKLGHGFNKGRKVSDETKKLISESLLKLKLSPPNKGKKYSEEERKRIYSKLKRFNPIIAIQLSTGLPFYFDCITYASKELKINRSTISRSIKYNIPTKKYYFIKDIGKSC